MAAPKPPKPASTGVDTSALDALLAQAAAGGAASTGNFSWTVPGTQPTRPPPGGVTEATLGRLGFAEAPPMAGTFNADNVGATLQGMSSQQFAELQQKLYAIVAYSPDHYGAKAKPVNYGKVGDFETLKAFYAVVPYAQRTGNLDQILAATTDLGTLGAQGPERQPLVIELPSADDLAAVLKAAAMDTDGIGRLPTPEELDRFAKAFRSRSEAYQRATYAAGGSGLPGGPGGTVERPAAPQAAAQEFLGEAAPVEKGAQAMERGLGVLVKMFGGGA